MSTCLCHDCSGFIDTDDDPGAMIEVGNMRRQTVTIAVCESCRERRIEDEEREMRKW